MVGGPTAVRGGGGLERWGDGVLEGWGWLVGVTRVGWCWKLGLLVGVV